LAKSVISSGGVVFGAAFSSDFHKVVHIQATTLEELEPIRVSKYVQSEVDSSFPLVKAALRQGKTVLFSGTPCQIAGIKSYVGEVPDNLILAEVVCHGVPSPKVWDVYLSDLEKDHGSKVSFVSFRDKSRSWRKSDFLVLFEDGTEFRQPNSENPYMTAFLKNLSLRSSCTRCRFKSFASGADITMGDFWGSTELGNSFNDDIGISVIALNTEKGHSFFDLIKPGFTGVIEVDEKTAFTFNESFCLSANGNEDSESFFGFLSDYTFAELVSKFAQDNNDRTVRQSSHTASVIRRIFKFFK
jgi:coenzyme F420-reducing hydrogenase beta subunit